MPVGAGETVCRNCGNTSLGRSPAYTVWLILFLIIGVPAACGGGCLLLVGASGSTNDFSLVMLGLMGLVLAAALLWMMIRSGKGK